MNTFEPQLTISATRAEEMRQEAAENSRTEAQMAEEAASVYFSVSGNTRYRDGTLSGSANLFWLAREWRALIAGRIQP